MMLKAIESAANITFILSGRKSMEYNVAFVIVYLVGNKIAFLYVYNKLS